MKATPALHAANPGKHGNTYVGTPYGASAIISRSALKYLEVPRRTTQPADRQLSSPEPLQAPSFR